MIPIMILSVLLTILATGSFSFALGSTSERNIIPVLLIHGYASNASVWEKWETLLENDNITAEAVTFADNPDTPEVNEDECGSAADHSMELNDKVKDFKNDTGTERINIIAHSKGGLDARVYLANNLSNTNVANLIMIGTPNDGSPLANLNEICAPAIFDLRPGSNATITPLNKNTKYYTIAGDWIPSFPAVDPNCSPENLYWLDFQRGGYLAMYLSGSNDGIVPLSNVQLEGATSLNDSDNCHTDLLGEEEYSEARKVLLGSE